MHYSIAKTEYTYPRTEVIYNSPSFRNTLEELESVIIDYLNTFEVQRRIPTFYRKSKTKKYGYVPLGYFIVKSKNFHKFTLHNKHLNAGYLYNTTCVEKVASFRITKNKNIQSEEPLEACEKLFMIPAMCLITKKDGKNWKEIHAEIAKKREAELTVL
jgi:hypothetical protein